jgi:hypothetical protein
MSTKAARGTKRTCQNSDCGARFYDLARDPIACPVCGTAFVPPVAAAGPAAPAATVARGPVPADPELADDLKPEGVVAEGEEALADIESTEDTTVAADDETFLEEEDDGNTDLTDVVGEGGDEPEEQ